MRGANKVILIGNATRNAELRHPHHRQEQHSQCHPP